MPTSYDGKPGNITTESPLTVTGASNTNPIIITVSGSLPAEFYQSGGLGGTPAAPTVHIADVGGNLNANGIFPATPTGPSTFSIPIAGSGAWTSGGTVQPLYLKTLYAVPSDGDSDNAASITDWATKTGDRTQFLASLAGPNKHIRNVAVVSTLTNSLWCNFSGAVGTGAPQQFSSSGAGWTTAMGSFLLLPTVASVPPVFAVGNIVEFDMLEFSINTGFSGNNNTSCKLAIYFALAAPGAAAPTWPTDYAQVPGGSAYLDSGGSTVTAQVSVHGIVGPMFTGANVYFQPIYYTDASGTSNASYCFGDTTVTVDIYRPTGMPQ